MVHLYEGSFSEGTLWKLALTRNPDPIRPTRQEIVVLFVLLAGRTLGQLGA